MTTQPEALRVADEIQRRFPKNGKEAAAELRRLHEAHEWQYTMAGQRLRRIEKLEASNQELLATLEWIAALKTGGMIEARARAAILKATRGAA